MTLKILCVHGIGRHEPGQAWETNWRAAIVEPLQRLSPGLAVQVEFVHLDAEFGAREISLGDAVRAVGKLTDPSLVVLKDFHPFLSDPAVVRWEELMWRFQAPTPWTPAGQKWTAMDCIFDWTSAGAST